MPQTLPNGASRTHANPLRSDLSGIRMKSAKARIGANSLEMPVVSAAFLEFIRQGMADLGVTQKVLVINAKHLGCTESAMSDAMNGVGNRNFSVEWFWAQEDAFVLHVMELAQKARGFTPDGIRATKIARIKELLGLLLETA
jgi:hypothetical protein